MAFDVGAGVADVDDASVLQDLAGYPGQGHRGGAGKTVAGAVGVDVAAADVVGRGLEAAAAVALEGVEAGLAAGQGGPATREATYVVTTSKSHQADGVS